MEYDQLKLDNQLCFMLYACSREITKNYRPFLSELGITYTQYITMLVLWEEDNITIKALGDKLYLDSGTLTPLLKKLEALGLIIRSRAKEDERNVYIKLTEDGCVLKEKAKDIPEKLLCSTKLCLNEAIELRENLKEFLGSLKDN
ncbi:MAG TPA: MarR family transcriptional regulator [Clostridiaceae bacterium]